MSVMLGVASNRGWLWYLRRVSPQIIHVVAVASPRRILHGMSNVAAAASPRRVVYGTSNVAAAASPRRIVYGMSNVAAAASPRFVKGRSARRKDQPTTSRSCARMTSRTSNSETGSISTSVAPSSSRATAAHGNGAWTCEQRGCWWTPRAGRQDPAWTAARGRLGFYGVGDVGQQAKAARIGRDYGRRRRYVDDFSRRVPAPAQQTDDLRLAEMRVQIAQKRRVRMTLEREGLRVARQRVRAVVRLAPHQIVRPERVVREAV